MGKNLEVKYIYLYTVKFFFNILIITFFCTNLCAAQQKVFSLKNKHLTQTKQYTNSIKPQKNTLKTTEVPIKLFNRMPNHLKKNKKRPIFCELEHQLSRAIKRKVKFGVDP